MSGQPSPNQRKRRQDSTPAMQSALIAFVAFFILFLWLHFALTQQIESIGREIQVKSEELRALERQHKAILKEIKGEYKVVLWGPPFGKYGY